MYKTEMIVTQMQFFDVNQGRLTFDSYYLTSGL